jgi:hypothetical protein
VSRSCRHLSVVSTVQEAAASAVDDHVADVELPGEPVDRCIDE